MSETTSRARGAGTRSLSVVVGPRRFDVVVDEHLLVGEVLALVEPSRELIALTMSGESVPLDETVALAHLETGTMLLTAPVDVDVPVPRLRRSAPDAVPAAGAGGTAGSRSPGPVRTSSPGGSSSRRRLGYATTTSTVEAWGHHPLAGPAHRDAIAQGGAVAAHIIEPTLGCADEDGARRDACLEGNKFTRAKLAARHADGQCRHHGKSQPHVPTLASRLRLRSNG